jgi:hypothetical protein
MNLHKHIIQEREASVKRLPLYPERFKSPGKVEKGAIPSFSAT